MNLDEYLNRDKSKDKLLKEKELILLEIKRLKIAFHIELSKNLMITGLKVTGLLHELTMEGKIKRINLDPEHLHPALCERIPYLRSVGINGFEKFGRLQWYMIAEDVEED